MGATIYVAVDAADKLLDLPAIEIGADYEVRLVLKTGTPSETTPIEQLPNMPLAGGYQAYMQARKTPADDVLLLNLSTVGQAGISIDPATGSLWLFVPASKTRTLAWDKGVYDILLKAPAATARGDGITKLRKGVITAELGATRIEN